MVVETEPRYRANRGRLMARSKLLFFGVRQVSDIPHLP
jgi:hypothetical protein